MVKLRGGGSRNPEAVDDQHLRSDIALAVAGKTNLTDDEIVSLLRSALTQAYSRYDRALLTERVAKLTPLPCRRGAAVCELVPPANLEAVDDQRLHSDIDSAVAGKTNLDDDEIVDLLRSALPQTYSRHDRALLTERVAKLSPLLCRRDAGNWDLFSGYDDVGMWSGIGTDFPQTYLRHDSASYSANKRRLTDHTSFMSELIAASSSSEEDDCSDLEETEVDLPESDEFSDGRRNASRSNRPRFTDLVLVDSMIQELIREVIRPLRLFKLLRHLGIEPAPRILLHGPPGCGKTTLARAIANEARVPFYEVSAAALVSGVSGAPEETIRKLFSTAYMRAPSVVLIDEIDAMTSKTESSQKVVPRLVNQLIACIDEPYSSIKLVNDYDGDRPGYVLVIAATSRLDVVDPALRRRFDREIVIAAPNEKARLDILSALTHNLKVEVGFDLAKIARCTLGFVAGDLVALVKKAGTIAVNRIMDRRMNKLYKKRKVGAAIQLNDRYRFSDKRMENLSITIEDFVEAGKMVQPSSKIECFSTTPNAKWGDVGGLESLKSEFERHIVNRIKFPEVYKDLGASLKTTFFVYGPNGCGKTFMVEALANEAGAELIHIKGPKLVEEFGDQADWVVRLIFGYARTCPPCILFFDEVEAITLCDELYDYEKPLPIFRQFLAELKDAKQRRDVYVISATNRPEKTHPSLTKGMFDEFLYVSLPSGEEAGAILKALSRNKPIDSSVDFIALVKYHIPSYCYTSADLHALMKEAAKAAIYGPTFSNGGCSLPTIKDADFKSALEKISPSGSYSQHKNCELFAEKDENDELAAFESANE